MRVLAISHNADIDGIGCVALLKMKNEIKDSDIFLIDYGIEALEKVERRIREQRPKGATLYITDLSANDEKVGLFLSIIGTIRKNGGRVFWYDHHPWTKKATRRISGKCDDMVIGEGKECASEITIKKLKLDDNFVKEFRRICHLSDFNLKAEDKKARDLIKTYAMGIASYNIRKATAQRRLKALAHTISTGKFANKDIVAEAKRFEQISNKRIRKMTKNLAFIGGKIGVGFSKSLQSSNACHSIMETSGRDIGIFINMDSKKGNIRSVKSNINPLAVSLGGGGHPHASGFSFDPKKYNTATEKGRLLLLDLMDRKAKAAGL